MRKEKPRQLTWPSITAWDMQWQLAWAESRCIEYLRVLQEASLNQQRDDSSKLKAAAYNLSLALDHLEGIIDEWRAVHSADEELADGP